MLTIITRKDHDPGDSFPALYREVQIAMRAPERHASRQAAALEAALSWLGHPSDRAYTVRALCWLQRLDTHGIGGPGGRGGADTTDVMSWRRPLGKGRRRAVDGEAWDRAIWGMCERYAAQTGASDVGPMVVDDLALMLMSPGLTGADTEWFLAFALSRLSMLGEDQIDEIMQWSNLADVAVLYSRGASRVLALARRYGMTIPDVITDYEDGTKEASR